MKRDETKLESAMARSELNRNTLAERANYWGIKKTNRIEVERGERNGRRKTDIYGRRNSYDGFHKRQSNINLGIGGGVRPLSHRQILMTRITRFMTIPWEL